MTHNFDTHDPHRAEYEAMGFEVIDIETGGATTMMTEAITPEAVLLSIDASRIDLEEALRQLKRSAFRTGAAAMREADCKAVCEFCAQGMAAEWLETNNLGWWIHNTQVGRTWCNARAIRNLPLPEMDKPD